MPDAMKFALVLLIFCAACTKREEAAPAAPAANVKPILQTSPKKNLDRELLKISKWFEQMDAILRESLWVVRKDRPPQSKSIFGKMQRAALVEMKEKLPNKSLFRCDTYSMSRSVGTDGIPQSAEVMQRCGSKESFTKIGDWNHPSANVLTMNFSGGNLEEVLGLATGILNPQISCELKSNELGNIESFSCKDLMIDYDAKKSQVLKFLRFEYNRSENKVLHLRAEVLESLQPVRKIEVDVPLEGKIQVIETVLQAPVVEAKPAPTVAPSLSPTQKPRSNPKENPHGQGQPEENPNQPILEESTEKKPGSGSAGEPGQAESGEVSEDPQRGTIRQVDPNQLQQERQDQRQRQNENQQRQEPQSQEPGAQKTR